MNKNILFMNTFTKIQSIFFSGSNAFRGNKESINDIAFLLDEGYLILNNISIAKKERYIHFLDELIKNEHKYDLASGGGKNHKALKLLAKEYLKKKEAF